MCASSNCATSPAKTEDRAIRIRRRAPRLGEHEAEVFAELAGSKQPQAARSEPQVSGAEKVVSGRCCQVSRNEKRFDAVAMMRSIRDKISSEIQGMTLEEELAWLVHRRNFKIRS